MTETGGTKAQTVEGICLNPDRFIRDFCALALFERNTPEYRALASRHLLDQSQDLELRRQILARFDASFDPEAENTLFSVAREKHDALRPAAISRLFEISSDSLLDFARNLTRNPAEDLALRLEAMEYLARHGDADDRRTLFRGL